MLNTCHVQEQPFRGYNNPFYRGLSKDLSSMDILIFKISDT